MDIRLLCKLNDCHQKWMKEKRLLWTPYHVLADSDSLYLQRRSMQTCSPLIHNHRSRLSSNPRLYQTPQRDNSRRWHQIPVLTCSFSFQEDTKKKKHNFKNYPKKEEKRFNLKINNINLKTIINDFQFFNSNNNKTIKLNKLNNS